MATLYITFSAFLTAFGNFLIRRGVTAAGDPYIFQRFLTAALFAILIIFVQYGTVQLDTQIFWIACIAGLTLGFLQYSIGKCLEHGPAALSFMFISSMCVIPPIIMFFLFGPEHGHDYTLRNLAGATLVIAGLLWMGLSEKKVSPSSKWRFWIATACSAGCLYQLILQWRALLIQEQESNIQGDLFVPITLIIAACCQMLISKPAFSKTGGLFAGIICSLSTLLLILGTECALTDTEKAIIFPLNTVLLITLCNVWAKFYYNEKINWPANGLAALGIAIN
ncbi:MAG: hypothetical protein JSR37_06575 [Verrucomicrobia bacterium]|nr:hypothetical protein [Verrucomicrobiota bacterium]MBS0636474.1 hypothetical protein [Verrucomicrobiota bacterium]